MSHENELIAPDCEEKSKLKKKAAAVMKSNIP